MDGSIIVLAAGEYSLSVVINKSFTIVGPNADLEVSQFSTEEALINVAKDVSGNLAAQSIVFNGVHLKGTGGGGGIPGISFQDGGSVEYLEFTSCIISDTNTFIKFVGGTSSMNMVIKNSHIHTIGQFIIWTTTSLKKLSLFIFISYRSYKGLTLISFPTFRAIVFISYRSYKGLTHSFKYSFF